MALFGLIARFAAGFFTSKAASAAARSGPRPRTHSSAGPAGGGRAYSASPLAGKPSPPTPSGDGESAASKRLTKLWAADTMWNLFERTSGVIDANLPSFTHSIRVGVVGGPAADMRRVWYLACATAFGRFRRRVDGVAEYNIEGVWDITGKAAAVDIAYSLSGTLGNVGVKKSTLKVFGGGFLFGVGFLTMQPAVAVAGLALAADGVGTLGTEGFDGVAGGISFMQQGPDQVTIGDTWPSWFRRNSVSGTIPDVLKGPSGVYVPYGKVTIDCVKDEPLARFTQNKIVDVLGEMVQVRGVTSSSLAARYYPFGQIVDVSVYDSVTGKYVNARHKPWSAVFFKNGYQSIPLLPDDGRLITTGEKRDPSVQPPRPWVDGESRMSTVDLIVQALHNPCYAPPKVPCPVVPAGGSGMRFYPASTGIDWTEDKATSTAFYDPTNPRNESIPRLGE